MNPRWHLQWIAVAIIVVASPGCLIFPYGIPTVAHIDELSVPSPGDDVHVFRVDGKATESRGLLGLISIHSVSVTESHQLTRIDCGETGVVDAQWNMGIERGSVYVGLLNGIPDKDYDTLAVHLYRPGYETIRIQEKADRRKLKWKPVPDNAERERAVDQLLGPLHLLPNENDPLREGTPVTAALLVRGLLPVAESSAYQEALLFCAAEYDRIAGLAPADRRPGGPDEEWPTKFARLAGLVADDETEAQEMHERLVEKAKALRKLAAE